jgi:cyanophycinase
MKAKGLGEKNVRLALIGGEEFAPGFEEVHQRLLSLIGGGRSRGVFLPTCAAHDGAETVDYWCGLAQQQLGPYAAEVQTPRVIDRASANHESFAGQLAAADWIYLGGGWPHIGMEILAGSRVLEELNRAAERGALILGASAGAMMMCARSIVISPALFSGSEPQPLECLGYVPHSICFPHFNKSYAQRWRNDVSWTQGYTRIGIDEQTALVHLDGSWQVIGRGAVEVAVGTLEFKRFPHGQSVPL